MNNKLTVRFLKNLKAPSQGRLEIFDTLLPGFGVRIGTSGRLAFFVMYRVHGKQYRQTLGRYPATSLADAEHFEAGDRLDDFLDNYPTVTHKQAIQLIGKKGGQVNFTEAVKLT